MVKKHKRAVVETPLKLVLTYVDLPKLLKFPWPWKDGSIEEMSITDCFHYVPAGDRGRFMEELYRVLVPEGKALIIVAYYSTALAFADYHLEWPPVCEQSFLYFNKGWREANKLPYEIKADFDFTYGYLMTPDTASRSAEVQTFHVKNYLNTVQRLQVALTKKAS